MGQSQSTSDSGSGDNATQETPLKRDYYELLGVERTATDDELKKAYRRKALELHPDRNYGNVEEATKLFADIQSAYEVLSDPQERAWYDSHRDVLLRGETVGQDGGGEFSYNVKMTTTEEVLKLMMKFNGKLEFTDAPSGFYGGLSDFFQTLAKEEDIACQWEDEDPREYPEFGSKNDDFEDVVRPFYAAWVGFATRKSYAWKDQYRLSDAPDRRIRRLMEKENKKLRDEAAQEFNDAVRSLVAFVRKRDPRVQSNQKSEAERQKALKEAAAQQAARARAARQAQNEELEDYVVPEWAQSRTKDQHEGGFSSESDVEEHEYDCVVCDKVFKSEAQYKAHEKSKKHVKLLKQLKKEMREEGHELSLEGNDEAVSSEAKDVQVDDAEISDEHVDIGPKGSKVGRRRNKRSAGISDEETDQSADEQPVSSPRTNAQSPGESSASEDEDEDSDYAPRSEVESRLTSAPSKDLSNDLASLPTKLQDTALSDADTTPSTPSNEPKLGKAKQKRLKKAAAATQNNKSSDDGGAMGGDFRCAVCSNDFPSKTKLFSHIKEKGHAAPLSQTKPGAKGGKGKKR